MASIVGATVVRENRNESDINYDAFGKNSEVITRNDPLTIQSGILSVPTAVQTIVGVAVKTATMTSDNQTVAKVTPGYIPAMPATLFLMGTNKDLTGNGTDGGTYYCLSGTTGAVVVDVSTGAVTGASRVVEIVEVDPNNIGGTGSGSGLRQVVVRFVKTPYENVTITA